MPDILVTQHGVKKDRDGKEIHVYREERVAQNKYSKRYQELKDKVGTTEEVMDV